MDIPSFRLLAADTEKRALLIVHGPSGAIAAEMAYPDGFTPTAVAVTEDGSRAFAAMAGSGGAGALFVLNLRSLSVYRLPVEIPHPAFFALIPGAPLAAVIEPSGTLYRLDTRDLTIRCCGQPGIVTCCAGLAVDRTGLYTIWESEAGGILACFSHCGNLLYDRLLPGVPTALCRQGETTLVLFTGADGRKGLALYRDGAAGIAPGLAWLPPGPMWPGAAALSPVGDRAYVAGEGTGTLFIFDLSRLTVTRTIDIGLPLSSLCLLPGGRYAAAVSTAGSLHLIALEQGAAQTLAADYRLAPYLAVIGGASNGAE
ncbi:hypothetical protein [Sporolituus thermophilus]|uniref:Uncharacterized protein n=1 Tax=Sporolituus thermophilus DSM 23256 TaxID=1123285 RepID=A0A1G7MH41_9FIRM|nr:hypothetical protein [Sporolituus thermophilus]SDF61003.1 hypothetical protein SAMN05660235_02153 [Sporolituus thermophilus DSM 23256]